VDRIVDEVRSQVRPGSIVLSHDFNQPTTVAAYEELLPWLADRFTLGVPDVPAPANTPARPTDQPTEPVPTESPSAPGPATPAPSEAAGRAAGDTAVQPPG
jgi:hypothetical protein